MAQTSAAACANCGAPLAGPYCAQCGQKAVPPDLTVREFLHESTHELTNWDGKVPSTLAALFLQPGRLSLDFLSGRRARWLSPLRVYLICSVAFFAGKPIIETVAPRPPREAARVTLRDDGGPLTPEERKEIAEGLPGRIFGVDRLERAAADPRGLSRRIDTAFSSAMFLLMPVFALLTSVAWRRARPRFPAHLYIALHLHAVLFGAALLLWSVIGFGPVWLAPVAIALCWSYLGWYGLVTFHRVFGETWGRTAIKTFAVAVVYSGCLMITALGLLFFAVSRI